MSDEAKTQPISPEDVEMKKGESFPDAVFEAFNQLILEGWESGSATIRQDDVVKLMAKKGLKRKDIFDKGWLNVEGVYRKVGWEVEYDKPGYNESYAATFTFRRPKK